jgi:hypothetical protein
LAGVLAPPQAAHVSTVRIERRARRVEERLILLGV